MKSFVNQMIYCGVYLKIVSLSLMVVRSFIDIWLFYSDIKNIFTYLKYLTVFLMVFEILYIPCKSVGRNVTQNLRFDRRRTTVLRSRCYKLFAELSVASITPPVAWRMIWRNLTMLPGMMKTLVKIHRSTINCYESDLLTVKWCRSLDQAGFEPMEIAGSSQTRFMLRKWSFFKEAKTAYRYQKAIKVIVGMRFVLFQISNIWTPAFAFGHNHWWWSGWLQKSSLRSVLCCVIL